MGTEFQLRSWESSRNDSGDSWATLQNVLNAPVYILPQFFFLRVLMKCNKMLTSVDSGSWVLRGLPCRYSKNKTIKTDTWCGPGCGDQAHSRMLPHSWLSPLPFLLSSYFYCIVAHGNKGHLEPRSSAQVLLTPGIMSECEWNKILITRGPTHICPPGMFSKGSCVCAEPAVTATCKCLSLAGLGQVCYPVQPRSAHHT